MKYLINTTYLSDSQKRMENVELSSSCPCCGVSLFPDLLYAVCVDHDDTEEDIVYTFNHCQNCDECFISKHPFDEENGDGFIYASSSPVKSCEQNFSEAITSLSPGYRKAIEFLVKDYTIHKSPNSKDAILKATLGACISNYIKDDRLTTLARAATWLGNDETHYVRQHPDYTLKELKAFADAFITFIDADLAYEAALKLVTP